MPAEIPAAESHRRLGRPPDLRARRASCTVPAMSAPVPPPYQPNRDCFCFTLDRDALAQALAVETGGEAISDELLTSRPHLFSSVSTFVTPESLEAMRAIAGAVERVAAHPAYIEAVLAYAPDIARNDPGPRGAFMGYDFHLGSEGPRLIEINTNAGGAFLNAALARAQRACCAEAAVSGARISPPKGFDAAVIDMFESEWRRQRGSLPLQRIAITDEEPCEQYLYPEFLLARWLLSRGGRTVGIVDAGAFIHEGGQLLADGQPIDLVYNRLTDFALEAPQHRALRDAYVAGDVVLTPNPRNHALFADKRNLVLLSDPEQLAQWGIDAGTIDTLTAGIPRTVAVTPERADILWADRRRLFFKPARGYGSKAAYRGDKVTRAVWAEIVASGFVAQAFAPPGERMVRVDGVLVARKMDVRLFTYAGEVILVAARLYQGQTTNFRTPGGGFSPVLLTQVAAA